MTLQEFITGAAVVEGILMASLDLRLRRHLRAGIREDQLGLVPLYWQEPDFFTATGNRYRRALVVLTWLMLGTVLSLAFTMV